MIVVGGGNSAGQGAIYLARYASEVEIVIRRDSLRDTMSQYLIEQIEKTPNIRLRPQTEVERVEGEGHVERVVLQVARRRIDTARSKPTRSSSSSARVRGATGFRTEVLRDAKGFVLTGRDLMAAEGYARIWKEQREPLVLETSVPGVFAAGDLRAGAMNRVASAVGEGSMVVRLAHEYLALT